MSLFFVLKLIGLILAVSFINVLLSIIVKTSNVSEGSASFMRMIVMWINILAVFFIFLGVSPNNIFVLPKTLN